MSGILRLENLNKGTTLKQGDKTVLSYRLSDADGEQLDIVGKTAVARLMHPDFTRIGYESEVLTVSTDNTVQFSIDSIIPSRLYYLEITVDGQYIFPSRSDEGKLSIDRSSMGAEITIIENAGIDAVVRKAVDLINEDPSLIIDEDKLISEIIANTSVGSIEEYYQEYRDAIKEYADLKPKAEQSISKSAEALSKSQNALNVANGIDAKATNALSLSESADTLSKSVQEQFNQVVIDGDSSVEAAQARVDASGQTNPTLKERLDKEYNEVTTQLTHIESANASVPISLTNHLGNQQNIHPKVLHFENGWNGFKYWMAYTPHPYGRSVEENPCLAVSNDMVNWHEPPGVTNPMDPPPTGGGWNNDTHLVYREDIDRLEIWWKKYFASSGEVHMLRRTSVNGYDWTASKILDIGTPSSELSPSVIFEDQMYKMWFTDGENIFYSESADALTWTPREMVNIDWGDLNAWHLDVIKTELGYEFVVQCFKEGDFNYDSDIYYVLQNKEGVFTKPELILARSTNPTAIDYKSTYRTSIMKIDGIYYLHYSCVDINDQRHMSLAYGRNIKKLNGLKENMKMPTNFRRLRQGDRIVDFDVSLVESFIVTGNDIVVESLTGGYIGQKIDVIIFATNAEAIFKYNSSRMVTQSFRDYKFTRNELIAQLICTSEDGRGWRLASPKTNNFTGTRRLPNTSAVPALDVTDYETIIVGGTQRMTLHSLTGGHFGKKVTLIIDNPNSIVEIPNSPKMITPNSQTYTLDITKVGVTFVCSNSETQTWVLFP